MNIRQYAESRERDVQRVENMVREMFPTRLMIGPDAPLTDELVVGLDTIFTAIGG